MRISDWSSDVCSSDLGMTRDFVQRELFKPFVSTKAAGFGLGALEALQLAQAMGGTIEVASEAGKGSCFALRLPHAAAGARSAVAEIGGATGRDSVCQYVCSPVVAVSYKTTK